VDGEDRDRTGDLLVAKRSKSARLHSKNPGNALRYALLPGLVQRYSISREDARFFAALPQETVPGIFSAPEGLRVPIHLEECHAGIGAIQDVVNKSAFIRPPSSTHGSKLPNAPTIVKKRFLTRMALVFSLSRFQ
jgi:hypothetical protein